MLYPEDAKAVSQRLRSRASKNKALKKSGPINQDPVWAKWKAEDKARLKVRTLPQLRSSDNDKLILSDLQRSTSYTILPSPSPEYRELSAHEAGRGQRGNVGGGTISLSRGATYLCRRVT
jgi:hypothetical protein